MLIITFFRRRTISFNPRLTAAKPNSTDRDRAFDPPWLSSKLKWLQHCDADMALERFQQNESKVGKKVTV